MAVERRWCRWYSSYPFIKLFLLHRWTMEMTPRFTPWVQRLVFTGQSIYTIDVLAGGKLMAQRDVWDGVQDNSFLSVEGLAFLLGQLTSGRVPPLLPPRPAVKSNLQSSPPTSGPLERVDPSK
jgi:hypothetical protein